jgi:hypothetical protein
VLHGRPCDLPDGADEVAPRRPRPSLRQAEVAVEAPACGRRHGLPDGKRPGWLERAAQDPRDGSLGEQRVCGDAGEVAEEPIAREPPRTIAAL